MTRPAAALLLLLAAALVAGCFPGPSRESRAVIFLAPETRETAADFQVRVRRAFSLARPGTVLEFGEGTFTFTSGLVVSASHVTVRGQGMHSTMLDFDASSSAEGILATGDHFLVQDLAVLDPPGDGVKAVGIDGFTARRVRVEWSEFADPNNGPYGIYPVLTENILIELCHVRGAEDAAIYVGQSSNALVRHNWVDGNVAGIEIENTVHADVRWNVATGNAAGILVFDLTGLSQAGRSTRVVNNWIYDNNGVNFGHGFLALVPSGTGLMVVSTDDVEIAHNQIYDNATLGIGVISYELTLLPFPDDFDAWPEKIHVHDNELRNNAYDPQGQIGQVVAFQFHPKDPPQIVWDGLVDPDVALPDGTLPRDLQLCVQNNGQADFGTLSKPAHGDQFDEAPYDCSHLPVPSVAMPTPPPLPDAEEVLSPEETAALCGAAASGVNWAAFEANCPRLADYNLFVGNDPRGPVVERGLEYELTTPLFSDYANKYRFVFVPPGGSAGYQPSEAFDFPVGTILSKTFGFDLPGGGEDVVETRLLIRRESGWKSLVYLWNDAFTEAVYAPEGAIVDVTFQHPDGAPRTIDYEVPDVNQCAGCHQGVSDAMDVIGPKARFLNRPVPHDPSGPNQLVTWETAGILSGLPALAQVDRLPVWDDPADGTLDQRARAYLESNCAHCHRPEGRAGFTSLWLEADAPVDFNLGICKAPIAAGVGAGGLQFDIVPGDPDASILAFRMDSAQPAIEMPELSKSIVHDAGVALVRDWIATLPGDCD